MSDLIDTTEMYLKTIYTLQEEGVPALRARIVERLEQSGPTVSETVARLERDGLLHVGRNREISFTDEGLVRAVSVMRRHRLVERLLTDVLGMNIRDVHDEACRWEHAVSDEAADLIAEKLGGPNTDPFGNPIPDPVSAPHAQVATGAAGLRTLSSVMDDVAGSGEPVAVVLVRIGEHAQTDNEAIAGLASHGTHPGSTIRVVPANGDAVIQTESGESIDVPGYVQHALFVEPIAS